MGRYSDSDDSDYRSSRRSKKKRRSRSKSRSDGSTHSSHSRHKKKKSKRSRRTSRSPRRRRSRSKSRSRDRRRRSRSGSESRSRRSRSKSYERRRRSRSRSRDRRRSSSNSRYSPKNESSRSSFKGECDPSSVPGFDTMSPLEQNEVRMQLALRAADLAAEKLKAAGTLETGDEDSTSAGLEGVLTSEETEKRRRAIENIESDTFKQAQFKSTIKNQTSTKKVSVRRERELSHDAAIFGDLLAGTGMDAAGSLFAKPQALDIQDPKSLLGPVFLVPESEKMTRWIDKLKSMRKHAYSNGSAS